MSQYFFPETFRGNDIVFHLIKKGYDVTVLTGKPNYPSGKFFKGYKFWGIQKENIRGVNVIRIPTLRRGKGGMIRLLLNYFSFVLFSYPYSRFKIDRNFDIIFVQQLSPVTMALPAIWALKRNKTAKFFLWVLDLWPESVIATTGTKNSIILNFLELLVKYICSKADYILVSSKSFEDPVLRRTTNKKIIYFPNWAEDIFEEGLVDAEFKIPVLPSGFNIMFAGNIGEAQDFETILIAARKLRNEQINWIIVGEGRKLNWVRSQVEKFNLNNVFIMGRYPIEAMPVLFKKADAMLLTLKNSSISELTVPAKLQAYLASGKIILAAINGESNSIINDNAVGLACESGNYKMLSKNALALKSLPIEMKMQLESNSLKLYKTKFSKKVTLSKLEELFKLSY